MPSLQQLCASGSCSYTSSYPSAQGQVTYAGTCARPVGFSDVYGKRCNPQAAFSCVFSDPLSTSPYGYSALQCVPSPGSNFDYSCLLGPNKAGDACFYNSECASGVCSSRGNGQGQGGTNVCVGVTQGGSCALATPTSPDPCAAGLFCSPDTGKCTATAKRGQPCSALAGCERGTACTSVNDAAARVCTPYMSVPVGNTTNGGPYMCAGGTALALPAQPAQPQQYRCVMADATAPATGLPCDPATYSRPGMECVCAASGDTRTRPIGGMGLGFNSAPYVNLNTCLLSAKSPTNTLCSYDFSDFERMRYGSCAFYACYPYYKMLVNGTGGRWFTEPLRKFSCVVVARARVPAFFFFLSFAYLTPHPHPLFSTRAGLLRPASSPPSAPTLPTSSAPPASTSPTWRTGSA